MAGESRRHYKLSTADAGRLCSRLYEEFRAFTRRARLHFFSEQTKQERVMITIDLPSRSTATAPALSKSDLTRFLNRARIAVGLPGHVDVLVSDDATLRRLNKTFRGKNKSTDVLSFPAAENDAAIAGDLAISL